MFIERTNSKKNVTRIHRLHIGFENKYLMTESTMLSATIHGKVDGRVIFVHDTSVYQTYNLAIRA